MQSLKKLKGRLEVLKYYCLGRLYSYRYDRKYLTGKYFQGKYHGITAPGWRWVYLDAKNCRRLQVNRAARFPASSQIRIVHPENMEFHPDDLNNFQGFGNYFQAIGKITIGKGTYIAPNVGIITANHDPQNLDAHLTPKPVVLGEQCWIGMNSVILPEVVLGNKTIVGAGSVVTKSFPQGHLVIGGNPAKIIKELPTTKI